MMKNKNKEIIINSINKEFDRERKKYSKKELKNMISLEEFLLKYYWRCDFYITFKDNVYIDFLGKFCPRNYEHVIYDGRFDSDVEVVKFIDENFLDEIYVGKFRMVDDYKSQDLSIYCDGYYPEKICICINRLVLDEVI